MTDRPLRTPFVAANWKMYKGPTATEDYVGAFVKALPRSSERTVAFFPPSVSLPAFVGARGGRDDLEVGVQDVHEEREGAHTGSVSAAMAADAGAAWGLAGHSERRREFGDDPEKVARKVHRLLEADLRPVLCVGETLEQRRSGELREVLCRQLGAVLQTLEPDQVARLVYAYEPVWAIGTGETAAPEDAEEAHEHVREEIHSHASEADARAAVILYGGSVKPHNAGELLSAPEIDGVLVGSASLDPDSFAAICTALE